MLIIALFAIIVITGVVLGKKSGPYSSWEALAAFGGVFLVIALIMLPISRAFNVSDIVKYESTKRTLASSRLSQNNLENAAVTNHIL